MYLDANEMTRRKRRYSSPMVGLRGLSSDLAGSVRRRGPRRAESTNGMVYTILHFQPSGGVLRKEEILQTRLPKLPTRLSEQLRMVMQIYEDRRSGRKLPLYLARQNIDGIEVEFSNMLVEDANNDNLSYVDYLCL